MVFKKLIYKTAKESRDIYLLGYYVVYF